MAPRKESGARQAAARARAVRDSSTPPVLRGAITDIAVANINVPGEFRSALGTQGTSLGSWRVEPDGSVAIDPPSFAVRLRVGSYYEPWVAEVRRLR